jgi:hypothetical protein
MALEPAQQKAAAEVVKAAQNSSIVKDHVDGACPDPLLPQTLLTLGTNSET